MSNNFGENVYFNFTGFSLLLEKLENQPLLENPLEKLEKYVVFMIFCWKIWEKLFSWTFFSLWNQFFADLFALHQIYFFKLFLVDNCTSPAWCLYLCLFHSSRIAKMNLKRIKNILIRISLLSLPSNIG